MTQDGEPRLIQRIRAEILERGPITVARFMERVLYEPGLGYYRRTATGPGRGGDYLTAPEAHPVFGAAIGRLAEAVWERLGRPRRFAIVEHGAGTGALALGLLDGLRRSSSPMLDAVRYRPLDIEAQRVATTVARLTEAGFGEIVDPEAAAAPEEALVVANEVVDALPVHRVVRRGGELRERVVAIEGDRLVEVDGPPARAGLVARLAGERVALADGQIAEVCLHLDGWVRDATTDLGRGLLLVIDYGEEAVSLYRPDRPDGTLRTFSGHAVGGDPYVAIGRRDITAHVDLTALRAAASAAGLEPLAETTQAEFLATIGAGELVAQRLHAADAELAGALELRSALARLLDPSGMGGFRVLAFGRRLDGWVPPGFERLRPPSPARR